MVQMRLGLNSFDRGVVLPAAQTKNLVGAKGIATMLVAMVLALAAYFWLLRPPVVDAVYPRIGPAVTAVYASGTVEASVMFPVAPRVGARLVKIAKDEHSRVKKGEILGRLEATDLAGNIAQLEAQAAFAKTDYERYARLMRENATSRQAYERALATWKAADAALKQSRAQAGFLDLVAPGDCTVIQRDGEVGQFIAANMPVFWLSCHDSLRISAQVDEEDIPLVKAGQKALIRADAFPGQVFEGTVTDVTPRGDPIGRSYRVRIGLPPGNPLKIGMTTEANIIAREDPHAILLPASAVLNDHVWKIVDNRAVQTSVVTGVRSNNWVEIRRGVSADDLILRDASVPPAQGKTLRPRQTAPQTSPQLKP
jgi:RND family efflux transporter MFP subunit